MVKSRERHIEPGKNGQVLTTIGGVTTWASVPSGLPKLPSSGDYVLLSVDDSVLWALKAKDLPELPLDGYTYILQVSGGNLDWVLPNNFPRIIFSDTSLVVLDDLNYASKILELDNISEVSVKLLSDSTVNFVSGSIIKLYQSGMGPVVIISDSDVIIRTSETNKLRKRWSEASLTKLGGNEWLLSGDLEHLVIE